MLQIYVIHHWNTQHQKMKGVRHSMRTKNMKITEMIWKTGYLYLKVHSVGYWVYWKIKKDCPRIRAVFKCGQTGNRTPCSAIKFQVMKFQLISFKVEYCPACYKPTSSKVFQNYPYRLSFL